MQVLSSSSPPPNSNFLFSNLTHKPSSPKSKFKLNHSLPPLLFSFLLFSPNDSLSNSQAKLQASASSSSFASPFQEGKGEHQKQEKSNINDESIVVRRPVLKNRGEEIDGNDSKGDDANRELASSPIDAILLKVANNLRIFEPERIQSKTEPKPLSINLDLVLYRAKILTRKYEFGAAERLLKKSMCHWPEDGRLYVALGKVLTKQSKSDEAKAVYEEGCRTTQGENPYIWQCWAILEDKLGNVSKARELFEAATIADKSHVASWHGWAVLELRQGNIKKARILLARGLKYCGGNEYIYQTLAVIEAKANRYEQARYLFEQATRCNPRSCASWLAWAQLEMRQQNNFVARQLFEKAIQASPKNRFAWHVWGIFEADACNVEKARKILKVGHLLNQRDPVLLQSLALLEYKHGHTNRSRALFNRASELDPKHQPVWMAWGWMEWKEGNISTARELYQRTLSINPNTQTAARCFQAWGVLEQKEGNASLARRLFRSSLNVNPQNYVTWRTWALLEEQQGNYVRAEEIRNLYFQQRTEVADDASWTMEFYDGFVDPALDGIKKLFSLNQRHGKKKLTAGEDDERGNLPSIGASTPSSSGLDLDSFIRKNLSLDPSNLDRLMEASAAKSQR